MDKLKEEIQSAVNVYKSGNLSKAEQVSKKLISSNPKVAFLYNLLGLILTGQKKIDEAAEWYKKGLKIDPSYAMIYNNLGLISFNKKTETGISEAKNYYKKSIDLDQNISEPFINLGILHAYLNDNDAAINYHKKGIYINPRSPAAHYNLSNVYLALGNFSEAKKHLKETVKLNPNFFLAHRNLSRIIKYTKNDEHLSELERIYKTIKNDDVESNINISFALGKAYEDIKDFDTSFGLYKKANSLCRKKIKFSIDEEIKRFDEITNTFDKNIFSKFKNTGYLDFSPIFIVGMPRSGTTLVEQILSSHDDVFGADEIDFIPQLIKKRFGNANIDLFLTGAIDFNEDDFNKIGKEYREKMDKISNNAKRSTDKLPINFQSLGFIKLILPNSKIVHCSRSPQDTIFSIYKNHFPGGAIKFAYDLDELVNYYNLYSDLMMHWNKLFPSFIFNISYENLIMDTKNQIKKLLTFCNLEWQDDCLKFYNNKRPIKTASDIQARNKIFNSSINSWKNYEKHLKKYMDQIKN
tara:strand:+ start:4803 stop:6371 length:1569 start_codon:yes stop_codon:yes gene_type:complete